MAESTTINQTPKAKGVAQLYCRSPPSWAGVPVGDKMAGKRCGRHGGLYKTESLAVSAGSWDIRYMSAWRSQDSAIPSLSIKNLQIIASVQQTGVLDSKGRH